MAKFPDTSLDNRHTGIIACSGGGKSQCLRVVLDAMVKAGDRVIVWDADGEYSDHGAKTIQDVKRRVIAGEKKGGGYVVYVSADNINIFRELCGLVWVLLNGKRPFVFVVEELADVCVSVGKSEPEIAKLIRRGRKYNLAVVWVSQRVAEISKTVLRQSLTRYVGIADEDGDSERMATIAGVSEQQILQLQPLEFFRKIKGAEPTKIKITYSKKKILKNF